MYSLNVSRFYKDFISIIQEIPLSEHCSLSTYELSLLTDTLPKTSSSLTLQEIPLGASRSTVLGEQLHLSQLIIKAMLVTASSLKALLICTQLIIEGRIPVACLILAPMALIFFILKIIANIKVACHLFRSQTSIQSLRIKIKALEKETLPNSILSLQNALRQLDVIIQKKRRVQIFSLLLTITALAATIALLVALGFWTSSFYFGTIIGFAPLTGGLAPIPILAISAGSLLIGSSFIFAILKIKISIQGCQKHTASYKVKNLLKNLAAERESSERSLINSSPTFS